MYLLWSSRNRWVINPHAGTAANWQHDSILFDFSTLNVLEFWKPAWILKRRFLSCDEYKQRIFATRNQWLIDNLISLSLSFLSFHSFFTTPPTPAVLPIGSTWLCALITAYWKILELYFFEWSKTVKLSNCRFFRNKFNYLLSTSYRRLKVDHYEHSISYSNFST